MFDQARETDRFAALGGGKSEAVADFLEAFPGFDSDEVPEETNVIELSSWAQFANKVIQ